MKEVSVSARLASLIVIVLVARTRLFLSLPQTTLKDRYDNEHEYEYDFGPTGPLTLALTLTLPLATGTDN